MQMDPWLMTYGRKDTKEGCSFNPKLAQALVEFKEYSDMRKLLCEVLSFTLLPEQIVDLRKEFENVDKDGDGEISFSALRQVLMQSAEAGSLGGLTENEVGEIFNAMRIRKSETKIRWHEFIAAGLSQCDFDERNLKLAFDRLDYDRKG
jgi:calcium-dependent protein kinase